MRAHNKLRVAQLALLCTCASNPLKPSQLAKHQLCDKIPSSQVGFELYGDLKKLSSTWPMVPAFLTVHNTFEMRMLWGEYLKLRHRPGVSEEDYELSSVEASS